MGSRIMHYCISTILNQKLKINSNQFLLGGLAPDVHQSKSELKEISHFMRKDEFGVEHVDYQAFYNKYMVRNKTPFHLGYYVHLISDDIWLKEIYYKKIKWLPQDIKPEAKMMYYRDFGRLNGRLIDYFSLELEDLEIQPSEIDEIDDTFLPELIRDLQNDFNLANAVKEESLEILEINKVIQTIKKTITICLANSKMT